MPHSLDRPLVGAVGYDRAWGSLQGLPSLYGRPAGEPRPPVPAARRTVRWAHTALALVMRAARRVDFGIYIYMLRRKQLLL